MRVAAAAEVKPLLQQILMLLGVLAVVATLQMPVVPLDQSIKAREAVVAAMLLIAAALAALA